MNDNQTMLTLGIDLRTDGVGIILTLKNHIHTWFYIHPLVCGNVYVCKDCELHIPNTFIWHMTA